MKYLVNFSLVVTVIVVAACGSGEMDKETQLQQLVAQRTELNRQIAEIEEAIAAEGPQTEVIKAKNVAVTSLEAHPFNHYVETQGMVQSENNIQVSAKSAGSITQVTAVEGQTVSRGQVLAQIDNSLILKQIEEVKSQLELAQTIFNRQKNLWDQKIGTEVQYLQAKSNLESLQNRMASLEEQNQMARITSPISGVVDEVNVKIGENIAPGMPAFRVVNDNDLKVQAKISEAYIAEVMKGNKAVVSIPELNDMETQATVNFVGRNIDALSRSFPVEIKLPSTLNLRPNMTAIVKVIYHTEAQALTVPVRVVQNINGEKVVYVAEESGSNTVARKKVVEVNGVFDDQAEVKGLSVGDRVITVGYQGLTDGDYVKI